MDEKLNKIQYLIIISNYNEMLSANIDFISEELDGCRILSIKDTNYVLDHDEMTELNTIISTLQKSSINIDKGMTIKTSSLTVFKIMFKLHSLSSGKYFEPQSILDSKILDDSFLILWFR